MAKKVADWNAKCPQCTDEGHMVPRIDLKAASSITVLICNTCEWEFAKDQSVKIHGNLVRNAAKAMNIHEGYSGLGEYVRDCIRRRNEEIMRQGATEYTQETFANLLDAMTKDPDKWAEMMKDGGREI